MSVTGQPAINPASRPIASDASGKSVGRIEAQLREWAAEFAGDCYLPSANLRADRPLHREESEGLALAVSTGLVTVQAGGRSRLAGALANRGPYKPFSRGQQPSLNGEYLSQIASFCGTRAQPWLVGAERRVRGRQAGTS
jgi:hypothetical protein